MTGFRGCWSCGAHGPCYDPCDCAKCVDPEGYDGWCENNPEEYESWLTDQELDDDEECDCPSCQGGEWALATVTGTASISTTEPS